MKKQTKAKAAPKSKKAVDASGVRMGSTTAKYKEVKFSAERIIALHKEGKNVSQIAQAIGYPKGHGNNRTKRVLIQAGLLK